MIKGICFLLFIFSTQVLALVPIEGLLYGDIKDIQQFDPLSNIHSKDAVINKAQLTEYEIKKFKEYIGLYRQGSNLKFSCESKTGYQYSTPWKEALAKRSIASTLQYIGLDLSMKAIVKYAKLLELTDEEFTNISQNLITNTCTQNLSVYSIKLLKTNFKHLYENADSLNFTLPDIQESPYFSESIKALTNSHRTKKNELNLSIKNFRAFCSWGGDTDDYRLMVPYLKNPYIMSYVFNQLTGKKIEWNSKDTTIGLVDDANTVQVACEDFICRNNGSVEFSQKFPLMIGTTDLSLDLESLYCGHFKNISYISKEQNPKIKKWINDQSIDAPTIESMNLVSLLTGYPDILVASNKFSDLKTALKDNITNRWDRWANNKAGSFVTDLLYEESLNIDLVSMVNDLEIKKGNFQISFDFSLGEMDRVLKLVDKITSTFSLHFPRSYLRWVRDDYIRKNNISDYKGMESLEKKVEIYINTQLKAKEELFLIPLWNKKMGSIMAKELISQLVEYRGSYFKDFSHDTMKIPVKFNYGLFALKYLNEKFKAEYRSKDSLSLTLVKP